ncbi:MAG: HAMP domain-containing protein [Chloroflexi bacterium]|nr:HAMP domain-containing protein [Chloroflexota bacterium]
MSLQVLLLQKETRPARVLTRFFKQRGDAVWQAWQFKQAEGLLGQMKFDLILLEMDFPHAEWRAFIQHVREKYPSIRLILTQSYPDLPREMFAREQGCDVIVRQPFDKLWLERALVKTGLAAVQRSAAVDVPTASQRVRTPVRFKITIPYVILALLFALAGAYIVSQVVLESVQDRYLNQLVETRLQAADWMVRKEEGMLATLRLIANTQGMIDAVRDEDAEVLRELTLPLAVNAEEEAVEVLDTEGTSLLSMRRASGAPAGEYTFSSSEATFQTLPFVQAVLEGRQDELGDKFAGLASTEQGIYLYMSGPVYDERNQVIGVLLVGRSLNTLTREMKQETLAEITVYDLQGAALASTLSAPDADLNLPGAEVQTVLQRQGESAPLRELRDASVTYNELLGPWEVRGGSDVGVLGVSLAQAFLVRTSQVTRLQIFGLVAGAILLVVLVGSYLARLITAPLERLVAATGEVARGNLEVKVEAKGDDELTALAHSFNYMIAGLQEGVIYRDLLGRTVSPAVREQLRETFSSGDLRLAGQQAVATVIMADIRGFTPISAQTEPALLFAWLNEYFGRLVPIVTAHGGVVNKFDGDAMLAFFGILPAPQTPAESAQDACQAAMEMIQSIEEFNRQREGQGLPPFHTGIGVHTGPVMAGGLGSSDRIHYTIIGDTVNTTQRLEALTRDLIEKSGILISSATWDALGENQRMHFSLWSLGQFNVKGKVEQLEVFRLLPPEPIIEVEDVQEAAEHETDE